MATNNTGNGHASPPYPVYRAVYHHNYDIYNEYHALHVKRPGNNNNILLRVRGQERARLNFVVGWNEVDPLLTTTCKWIQQIGWMPQENLAAMKEKCEQVPPPEAQWIGERRIPGARSSRDWVLEAVAALQGGNIMEPLRAGEDNARIYSIGWPEQSRA
ncbi:hypothetical protein CONLIGDRAFT_683200 [Coniochaeta ligniaria NRRL 30616]|uniref:Uncharacterized protein n=1 Tax=Coniochaeta ligniaria NRRL 30616 TaxID=1408157 RepID=A0A1J7IFZ8_9PEZI|nr:hypothetical protein CONLIGDRAFT_683200 [Coniochaeta ligniaria NRRL 30616]